jgi:diadenylate cyclase
MSYLWMLDLLDIGIVTFAFYKLLVLVKGTRAFQMVVGLTVIFVVSVVSKSLQLNALNWLFSELQTVWIVAFVVIFQPELRRFLSQAGQSQLYRRFFRIQARETLGEITRAAQELSTRRIGALIVVKRSAAMRAYIETGTRVDAVVTAELLQTLFVPKGPLHDGAVIIEEDRVVAAGCILPLSQSETVSQAIGTRHRAALGLTEETDAIVVVVSEETGQISLARRGKLSTSASGADLLKELRVLVRADD